MERCSSVSKAAISNPAGRELGIERIFCEWLAFEVAVGSLSFQTGIKERNRLSIVVYPRTVINIVGLSCM